MDLGSAVLVLNEANGLTQSNVRATLQQALRDAIAGMEGSEYSYGYLVDVIGDDSAGWIIYELSGKCFRCTYTISQSAKARSVKLGISKSEEVMPRTVYDRADGTVVEGSRKSAEPVLQESAQFCEEIPLAEATKTDYLIKVIAPGQGSSAFYPAEVLKRDGPKVFTKGLHMNWNHPTAQQESERPEGDLSELAAVLTTNAYYDEAGPKGPGLYARAKVFADYAEQVAERGPHIGVSIRAYGEADTKGGVKTLKSFTRAESVDFVTKPGAGGAVLTESAKETTMDEAQVKALIEAANAPILASVTTLTAENNTLKESNRQLQGIATKAQARAHIAEKVRTEKLPEAAKLRVVDALLAVTIPVTEAGVLDVAKLDLAIVEAVKAEATYIASITGNQLVMGMGLVTEAVPLKPEELDARMLEHAKRHAGGAKVSPEALAAMANGRGN